MAINYQGGNDVVVTQAFAPMMKTLQQNYIYEQEKQEQERKELNTVKAETQKQLAKINPNGIWEGDAKLVGKAYDEIKELNFQMEKARTPEEKRMKSLEIQGKATELINTIANSKEYNKEYFTSYGSVPKQIGKMDTTKAISYLDSAKGQTSDELRKSNFLPKLNDFYYKYDPVKIDSAVSKVATDLLKNVPAQRTLADTVTGSGGRRTDVWNVTKTANETQVLEQLSRLAKGGNRDVETYVQDLMSNNNVDFNTAVGMLAEEFSPKFNTQTTSETSADKASNGLGEGLKALANALTKTPSEEISTVPLQIGKFTSNSSITRNEKGVLLSGNKEFFDPSTGQKIKVGRDNFSVDYTQDVKLGIDKNGNPVDENSSQAVGTQNFSVAQMVDPSVSSIQANIPAYANIGKRTVLIPEGDRQLFGASKTVKADAERRSKQNTNNKQPSKTLSGGNVR